MIINYQNQPNWRLAIACLAVVAAYGLVAFTHQKSSAQEDMPAQNTIAKTNLSGKWVAQCHKVGGNRYVEETYIFINGTEWTRDLHIFSAEDCPMDSLREIRSFSGHFEITGEIRADEREVYKIDYTIDRVFKTPVAETVERNYNDSHFCNLTDWRAGEKRDITGLICRGKSIGAGATVYDIVLIQDKNKILFGRPYFFSDSTNSKSRPKRIDKEVTFERRL